MTTNLMPRSMNQGGMQINDFTQVNDLTANRACIDELKCPIISNAAGGGGGGTIPDGTNYSDYLFWDPTTSSWQVGQDSVHEGTNAGLGQIGNTATNIAIGYQASGGTQAAGPERNIAGGLSAGYQDTEDDTVLIGTEAGAKRAGEGSIAIGYHALYGGNGGENKSVAIGWLAGQKQQNNAIAVGTGSGYGGPAGAPDSQGENCIAIGYHTSYDELADIGGTTALPNQIVIGTEAGYNGIGERGVAIGYQATGSGLGITGTVTAHGRDAVMIGTQVGNDLTLPSGTGTFVAQGSVGIGYQAMINGNTKVDDPSIAIGSQAGKAQASYAIAIGIGAAAMSQTGANPGEAQGTRCIAIGYHAAYAPFLAGTAADTIAIGSEASTIGSGQNTICIGTRAGYASSGSENGIFIGHQAGEFKTNANCIGIGFQANNAGTDGVDSIAIGSGAGSQVQKNSAIAIGYQAAGVGDGLNSGGENSIAIGYQAGAGSPGNTDVIGDSAIAIGVQAGLTNHGNNSIAIGSQANSSGTGYQNAIALNSSGTALNVTGDEQLHVATVPVGVGGGLQVPPLAAPAQAPSNIPGAGTSFDHYLVYNPSTGEIRMCPI